MPRSKPFSGKAKKEQLRDKRAKRRGEADDSDDSTDKPGTVEAGTTAAGAGGVTVATKNTHVPEELLTSSLGKSGKRNRFSTVFAREENETVQLRRNESADPLNIKLRSVPWLAKYSLNNDPVLTHPSGVLLKAGSHTRDRLVYLHADTRALEEASFTEWLNNIYKRYKREDLNYFEHSIEVWQQLWHTLASSDVICIVADVRNPLWHLPHSLYEQVTAELKKPLIILLNKTDLVSQEHIDRWCAFLRKACPLATAIVPFSSSAASLGGCASLSQRRKALADSKKAKDSVTVSRRVDSVAALLSVAGCPADQIELVAEGIRAAMKSKYDDDESAAVDSITPISNDGNAFQSEKSKRRRARKLKKLQKLQGKGGAGEAVESGSDESEAASHDGSEALGDETLKPADAVDDAVDGDIDAGSESVSDSEVALELSAPSHRAVLTIGMVGHPNAGKSSVINTICADKRVSVSRTAGHTKRAQTVPVCPGLHLLDCPGLVFPHALAPMPEDAATADRRLYEAERAMQELLGVIPIAQVREPYTAVRYLAERLPLERMYGLQLPKDEDDWTPLLICETLAVKKGLHIARTGRPDAHAAGRQILYDSQDGIIPIAWLPPEIA